MTAHCFLDGARFHTWAGGADYSTGRGFSPNYVLFYEEVRMAIACGCACKHIRDHHASFATLQKPLCHKAL